jgi:hypothetical protein
MVVIGSLAALFLAIYAFHNAHGGDSFRMIYVACFAAQGLIYGALQIRSAIKEKTSPAAATQSE